MARRKVGSAFAVIGGRDLYLAGKQGLPEVTNLPIREEASIIKPNRWLCSIQHLAFQNLQKPNNCKQTFALEYKPHARRCLTSTYDAFLRLSIRTPEPKTAHGFRDVSLNNQINSVDSSSKIPKRFLSWYSQFRGNSQAHLRASHLEPNLHGTATDKQNMPSKIVGRHLSHFVFLCTKTGMKHCSPYCATIDCQRPQHTKSYQ